MKTLFNLFISILLITTLPACGSNGISINIGDSGKKVEEKDIPAASTSETPTVSTNIESRRCRIAFNSNRVGSKFKLYVLDASTNKIERIIKEGNWDDTSLSWSPDGTQIAFTSNRDGFSQIYIMNADGSNPRRLSNSEWEDLNPAWSPDGSRIAFHRNAGDDKYRIYTIDPSGNNLKLLTTDEQREDAFPAWSPDSRWIATCSRKSGQKWNLHIMKADGSAINQMTKSATMDIFCYPQWSPDGKSIAFTDKQKLEDNKTSSEVFLMQSDGSGMKMLTSSVGGDFSYSWLPDGKMLSFTAHRDNNTTNIYVMFPDGSRQQALVKSGSNDRGAWFSPECTTEDILPLLPTYTIMPEGTTMPQPGQTLATSTTDGKQVTQKTETPNMPEGTTMPQPGQTLATSTTDGKQVTQKTETPKPTNTPDSIKTPEGLQIINVKSDVNKFFYQKDSCGPNKITFTAEVTQPNKVYALLIFTRFESVKGGGLTKWDASHSMRSIGGGKYTITLESNKIQNYNFYESALMHYQLVAQNNSGSRLVSTEVVKTAVRLEKCR